MKLSGGNTFPFQPSPSWFKRAGGRTAIASAKNCRPFAGSTRRYWAWGNTASTLFAGQALPRDILAPIVAALGPFPSTHLQHDAWTTKAVDRFPLERWRASLVSDLVGASRI